MGRAALFASACAATWSCTPDVTGGCEEVCAAANDCVAVPVDCGTFCGDVAKNAEATSCEGPTDAYYDCRKEAQACDEAACDAEYGEVRVCLLDFCDENPKHELCDFGGG